MDPNSPLYVHIDWVKPGRHTFVIKHDEYGPDGTEESDHSASHITLDASTESKNMKRLEEKKE